MGPLTPAPGRSLSVHESVTSVQHGPNSLLSPEHLDASDRSVSVTAMGTVAADHDVSQAFENPNEFYGSSSAASFMKEAYGSMKTRGQQFPGPNHRNTIPPFNGTFPGPDARGSMHFAQADQFALPPRSLADHLLAKYFERMYWLYPIFHKPAFERAYESLWRPSSEQPKEPPMPGLGLGSCPGAGSNTIVFHSALNTIFAIGCQFSDLSPPDKVSALQTFFTRAKSFVGLDMLDMHNIGVVQSFLLMTMFLQGTPYPSRCWNSVGVATRVAQGLGLHAEPARGSPLSPLETEIRRRTWHGCVVLDM